MRVVRSQLSGTPARCIWCTLALFLVVGSCASVDSSRAPETTRKQSDRACKGSAGSTFGRSILVGDDGSVYAGGWAKTSTIYALDSDGRKKWSHSFLSTSSLFYIKHAMGSATVFEKFDVTGSTLVAVHPRLYVEIDTDSGTVLKQDTRKEDYYGFYEEYVSWQRGDREFVPTEGGVVRTGRGKSKELIDGAQIIVCGRSFLGLRMADGEIRQIDGHGESGRPLTTPRSDVSRLVWNGDARKFTSYQIDERMIVFEGQCWRSEKTIEKATLGPTGFVTVEGVPENLKLLRDGRVALYRVENASRYHQCKINPTVTRVLTREGK